MSTKLFITGTDTDIGKTFVSALLVKKWGGNYWKPIQTGLSEDCGDTATVKELLQNSGGVPERSIIHDPSHTFMLPLSPWRCTVLEKRESIKLEDLVLPAFEKTGSSSLTIIEGAGGLLVPICKGKFTTDLIKHLSASVVLVARSELGTLNHTLMSLEVLRSNKIPVIGVILNGPLNEDNATALSELGVPVIAQIPLASTLDDVVELIPPFEVLFKT